MGWRCRKVEVIAEHVGSFHGQQGVWSCGSGNVEATFADYQLVFRPGGVGDAVVGLDKLAGRKARIVANGISGWRR